MTDRSVTHSTFVVERSYDASPARVFAAWADPGAKAAFDGDVAVSFCYAGWETETWWDVSIDTLPLWRARGFAEKALTLDLER